ncbi:MAG: hypothetical protein IJR49_03240 [Treponema sp.]|nr:hypothetical protein [Treponema sp.]
MERKRSKFKIIIGCGLLIFFASSIYSQSSLDIRNLRIFPEEATAKTDSECLFTLRIPSVRPSDVQIDVPNVPSGVSFVSLQRASLSLESGTEIKLWFTFKRAGTYTLPPLNIRINNRSYSIPFLEVNIEHEASDLLPRLVIRFDNGTEINNSTTYSKPIFTSKVGEKNRFTIYLQHGIQVTQFSWTAPKNAILHELQRYEMLESTYRKNTVSQELVPVARFEWQILEQGTISFPDIQISAIAYNGNRMRLSSLQASIVVENKAVEFNNSMNPEQYFAYAFENVKKVQDEDAKLKITANDCRVLANLRSKERHSILPFGAIKERKAFEEKLEILSSKNEINIPLVLCISVLFASLFILAFIFFIVKKRSVSFICLCCSVCIFVFLLPIGLRSLVKGGIATGGQLFAVPDKTSHIISVIPTGIRLSVEENTGNWLYVQYGSMEGWVESNHIIIIE